MKIKQIKKKTIFILGLSGLIFISGLYAKSKIYDQGNSFDKDIDEVVQNDSHKKTGDSLHFKPHYFNMLYKYILKNGKVEKVNASSRSDKPLYIEYHVLSYNKWELKVDKSNRIYFVIPQPKYKHYGNILLVNNSFVKIECQDKDHAKKIYEVYNEILKTIDKK